MSLDGMFKMRNERPSKERMLKDKGQRHNERLNGNIVIIGIDDRAISRFGRFPFPRRVYAKFLNRLKNANPRAVFFDIFFPEYSNRTDKGELSIDDKMFFSAIKKFKDKNIFVDYPPMRSEKVDENLKQIMAERIKNVRYKFQDVPGAKFLMEYNYAALPVPEILENVKGVGHAAIEPDSDKINRKIPLVIRIGDALYPQIVFRIILDFFQVSKENVKITLGKDIILKNAKIPKLDEFGDIEVDDKGNPVYYTRDIRIPIDHDGKMLINYVGYPGEFKYMLQYYSFTEVFDKDFYPENFDGKFLFIGAFAQGMAHDIWATPHGNMYGIEINANGFNTLLQQDFLLLFPKKINYLIVILLGIIIGLFVPRIKIWQSILVIFALILILSYFVFFYVFFKNYIMLYWVPLLTIIFAFIGTLLYRILTEEKEKMFIKSRFSKYVSSAVVDELLKNPKSLELGGEDRFITVLFSDVRSFTTISEQLGEPQKLVALLNEYLSAMTDLIFRYNGTLDKYVGDEIMAFWGAPVPQEDHALLACKSALAQIKYLYNVLHKKWEEEGKPKLRIGIGINTGIMTVGNMGSESRMDYTLMGDNVNLGARLEGTNKVYGTSIIISEFTYNEVKDKVITRELDIIRVKGKKKPVKIYELIDLKDEEIEV